MATQFDATPTSPRPVNQKLMYTLSDAALAAGNRFIVKILEGATELYKVYLQPNAASKAHFDASKVLKDLVNYDWLTSAGTLMLTSTDAVVYGTSGAKTFTVQSGLFTGTSESLGSSNTLTVVKGAQQVSNGLNPSWSQYTIPTTGTTAVKGWLTDLPTTGTTITYNHHKDDVAFHGFLQSGAAGIDGVLYQLYNADGSTSGSPAGASVTVTDAHVHYVATSAAAMVQTGVFTQAQVDAAAYGVIKLRYGVTVRSYDLISRWDCVLSVSDKTQVAYGNANGGIDYLWMEGTVLDEVTVRQKTYQKSLGNYDAATYTFSQYDWQEEVLYREGTQQYQLVSRRFDDTQLEMAQNLVKSTSVMIRIGTGDWMPVIVDNKSFSYRKDSTIRAEVSLKVKLAQPLLC